MRRLLVLTVLAGFIGAAPGARAEQTILTAFAPADTDGIRVILRIDWEQVKHAAADVKRVMIRRRPAGIPVAQDTVTFLPADSFRFEDTGLDPDRAYHYYAYFKLKDRTTARFGSYPAVMHIGPLLTRPEH